MTPKRIIYGLFLSIFGIAVVLQILGAFGVIFPATGSLAACVLFFVSGVVAYVFAESRGKKKDTPNAVIAYRVSFFCLFLALNSAQLHESQTKREMEESFQQRRAETMRVLARAGIKTGTVEFHGSWAEVETKP